MHKATVLHALILIIRQRDFQASIREVRIKTGDFDINWKRSIPVWKLAWKAAELENLLPTFRGKLRRVNLIACDIHMYTFLNKVG